MIRNGSFAPLWRLEFVLGLVEMQSVPPRCIPDPAQEHRFGREVVGGSAQRYQRACTAARPAATLDGAASGRNCGSAAATRFNISRTSSGGSSTENTVVTLERVSAGRPAEVRERRGGQHRVGHDQQPAAGIDMRCAPVDFDHAAFRRRRFYPVAELKRLLEQDEQARDDLPDGVLQRQAEHDRRHAERGEQAADIVRPRCRRGSGRRRRRSTRTAPRRERSTESDCASFLPGPPGTRSRSGRTAAAPGRRNRTPSHTTRTGVASPEICMAPTRRISSAPSGRM